jgi:hypothetical protein
MKTIDLHPTTCKGFLAKVLCGVEVAAQMKKEPEDLSMVHSNQFSASFLVTRDDTSHQPLFRPSLHPHLCIASPADQSAHHRHLTNPNARVLAPFSQKPNRHKPYPKPFLPAGNKEDFS